MTPTALNPILWMVATFLSTNLALWALWARLGKRLDGRTRELIKAETISSERVRDLARQEAELVFARSIDLSRAGVKLDTRELLREHELREDDRLVKAILRVETAMKEGIESVTDDSRRVEKRLSGLSLRMSVVETNIAVLLEREHIKSVPLPPTEPDSKP